MIHCRNGEMLPFHLPVSVHKNIQPIFLALYFVIKFINISEISIVLIELSGSLLLVLFSFTPKKTLTGYRVNSHHFQAVSGKDFLGLTSKTFGFLEIPNF